MPCEGIESIHIRSKKQQSIGYGWIDMAPLLLYYLGFILCFNFFALVFSSWLKQRNGREKEALRESNPLSLTVSHRETERQRENRPHPILSSFFCFHESGTCLLFLPPPSSPSRAPFLPPSHRSGGKKQAFGYGYLFRFATIPLLQM